jgi:hypothetical protein
LHQITPANTFGTKIHGNLATARQQQAASVTENLAQARRIDSLGIV